jgi:hypothetical protein
VASVRSLYAGSVKIRSNLCTGEIAGYTGRIISANESPNYSIGYFAWQSTALLLAPVMFAASIYMCLGRIILLTDSSSLSPIPPRYLTILFVSSDVLGLLVQGSGAIIMPLGTLSEYHIGSDIVIAGLALMAASFAVFIFVALTFDYRVRRHSTKNSSLQSSIDWNVHLWVLYSGSILIFVRSVFRLVEYAQGNSGWLISHEWTLYFFDSTLMFVVLVMSNVWHPSHLQALLTGGRYCEKVVRIVDMEKDRTESRRSSALPEEV